MGRILNGKEASEKIMKEIEKEVTEMDKKPKFVIVLVGEDSASKIYVNIKAKRAREVGIDVEIEKFSNEMKEEELLEVIEKLNKNKEIDGYIVQSPLPPHIREQKIIESINPDKDVDGWTSYNAGKYFLGIDEPLLPATPAGIIALLDYYGVEIEGKNVVVVGRSNIVGKPLAVLLLEKNATITVCHSKTKNLEDYTKRADILISAVGKPGIINAEMVKENSVVIDVGTTKTSEGLKGDVEGFEDVIKKADCSPVPGGVGPMTVTMLLKNVVKAAKKRQKNKRK